MASVSDYKTNVVMLGKVDCCINILSRRDIDSLVKVPAESTRS